MSRSRTHLIRLAVLTLLLALAGLLTGHWLAAGLLTLAMYTGWLLVDIKRFRLWLRNGAGQPPERLGTLADLYEEAVNLRNRRPVTVSRAGTMAEGFRDIIDAFPDAILVIDEHDSITWFNSTARQLLDLKPQQDIGRIVTDILQDPAFDNWIAVEREVASPLEMHSPLDSSMRLSVNAIPFDEQHRLLILRDVTDFHILDQVRRDFVANVSHELRSPLTVLLGYLETLRDETEGELRPTVERMYRRARQMQSLIDDLLELSRLQSERRDRSEQEVDVSNLLSKLKAQAEEVSQGRHEIRLKIEDGPWLRGIAADLESAFRNLIHNAVNYTPDGGRITIRWSSVPEGAEFIVEDTGVGIPPPDIPRLTERFYRVGADRSRNSGGTGLGLAIVKHVLNIHQAKLDIHSELGKGSRFRCVFPPECVMDSRLTQSRTGS